MMQTARRQSMSRTLHFTQHLLNRGRHLQDSGQNAQASRLLTRLSSFRELPADIASETCHALAKLHLNSGQFKKARRQLVALLTAQPENAEAHFLLGDAVLLDETCDERRALLHYRRAAQLDADNPEYQYSFGMLALEHGLRSQGLRALHAAAKLAADDPALLDQVADGLRGADEAEAATRILRAALFRNARDLRFRNLWTKHQFELLRVPGPKSPQRRKPASKTRSL
jgi:tetratricopeptide (TPR) repeat protein